MTPGLIAADNGELCIDVEVDDQRDGWRGDPMLILPYDRLRLIVASVAPDCTVVLDPSDTGVRITAGRGSWTLPTLPSSEWPTVEDPKLTPVCRLPADQFARMASNVRHACDVAGSGRLALGAVCVEMRDGTLSLVGTDGRHMCVSACEIDQATEDSQTLVPRKSIDAMVAAARHAGDAGVQLERSATQVVATFGGTTITARQMSGHYAKWREIGTARVEEPTEANAGMLLALCGSASICTSETSRGVEMTTGKSVRMRAVSSENGEAVCECDCVSAGATVTTKIDPSYAAEWLRSLELAETVAMHMTDAESALVLVCEDTFTVIMPLVA
jgi:DNA polymerase-3 subunit beta